MIGMGTLRVWKPSLAACVLQKCVCVHSVERQLALKLHAQNGMRGQFYLWTVHPSLTHERVYRRSRAMRPRGDAIRARCTEDHGLVESATRALKVLPHVLELAP